MEIFKPEQTKENKYEHLKEGVSPVMACIGTFQQFKNDPEIGAIINGRNPNGIYHINFATPKEELKNNNFKNGGVDSYIISPVDDCDKFFDRFKNCTGLLVAGKEKETGKNISFVSHEEPKFISRPGDKERFILDLKETLAEIKKASEERTIDAVIFGGNYFVGGHSYQEMYGNSIKTIVSEVEKSFGFKPVVITGPKLVSGEEKIVYDNENRRLFIMRPEVGNSSAESYAPDQFENQREKWEKDGKNIFFS